MKICYATIFFVLYSLSVADKLFSQNIPVNFERLTMSEGLSHNKVQCILQDRQGYMWFGTVSGLNRYDGYSFKVFQDVPGDSTALANDNIVSLYQDKEGYIWIGTFTSFFSRFDPHTETFRNFSLPALKIDTHDFLEDESGLLWLATGYGLFSFNKKTEQLVYHSTDDSERENIQGILQDKDRNILWLSTETGIRKFNKKTGKVQTYMVPYPSFNDIARETTHNIIQDKFGNIWMTTSDKGVYCFNPQTEKFKIYSLDIAGQSSATNKLAIHLMEDSDGKIWISGEGVAVFDPVSQSFSFNKIDPNDPHGIPGKVRTLLKDRSGIYWLGTERGIAKYDAKLNSSATIKSNPPLTVDPPNTLLEDNDHKFWVGSYIGLGQMDESTGLYKDENEILGSKNVSKIFSSLLDKDASMWFSSESCLFHIYQNNDGRNTYTSDKIPLPASTKADVTAIDKDPSDILWVGTRSGQIFSYSPATKSFKQYKSIEENLPGSNNIRSVLAISTDSILFGTQGKGCVLLQPSSGKLEMISLKKNERNTETDYSIINALYKDSKKNIWIGTESGGLWQTDASLLKSTNFTIKDGLQSMDIKQIVEDNLGQIWLNSDLGLDIIDVTKKRFVHYSEKDGLSVYNQDYLMKESSGDIMRIDVNGLHVFHSSSINLNKSVPPVYINRITVLDKQIPIYNDTVLHLHYFENYISFAYVALNYTQSYKNSYQYRLIGLDKSWIDAEDRRFTSYANIGPGTYTFEVIGCNNEGVCNENPARITLIIASPWYNTWWFYTSSVVLIAGIVYFLFQYRLSQKLKAFELRNRISRDLHDEVGSTLSSISFLSSMALNDVESQNVKAQKTLTTINESSHRMLDAMNDIIWSIQPQNDTLNNVIARMLSFASEILEARKIKLLYHIESNLKHLHVGVAVRHDFFMIFKEAVNNLAKYSEATEAHISLEFAHPYLILTIRDNGKGFDPAIVRNGNGLKNMQNRAKNMSAKYQLHTVQGKGTSITLQVRHDK